MATPQLSAKTVQGKIRLEVVTPEGVALNALVDEFTSPSVQGEFGVLPGHLPLLAALRTGVISYRKGTELVSCAVGPGFVEVADDHAVLLTDRYSNKESIDVVDARMQLKEADEKLAKWDGEPGTPEHHALVAEEQWYAALLELYGDPRPPVICPLDEFKAIEKSTADEPSASDDEAK
jgi:F-type H+-transporting ATPase subunit epsilon